MRMTKTAWLVWFGTDDATFTACIGDLEQFPYPHQRVRTQTLDSGEILILRKDRRRLRRRIRTYVPE